MIAPGTPRGGQHFDVLRNKLIANEAFSFIRFSDGEMEIIRNEYLEIGREFVVWSKGVLKHNYPEFDKKTFDPDRHQGLRNDLIESAEYKGRNFFKGIPTSHNAALEDKSLMIKLNGESIENLTFADLFLNENYRRFIREILPLLVNKRDVFVVGNFRMRPEFLADWKLVAVGDNFFEMYPETLQKVLQAILQAPPRSTVLSSASSLSNIVGMHLHRERPDLTFIDIGTSLHGYMGMESNVRRYHYHAAPWSRRTALRKIYYLCDPDFRLRW